MMSTASPKTDKEWEAHHDAHTLAEAQEILKDEKRLKAAAAAAEKIAKEVTEQAERMGVVAKGDLAGKMYPKVDMTWLGRFKAVVGAYMEEKKEK